MCVLLHRSRGGQPRHVCPARAPRDRALLLRLPGAERATGVLPQLANRGVRRGVQLQRPPHHRAVRDGDDDALPSAATGCEAQAMEEHAAEDIKHFRPTTVRPPAARSLPDLCPSASLRSVHALCTVHLEHRHHAGTRARAAAGAQDGGGPGAPHAALPRQGRDGRVPRQGANPESLCRAPSLRGTTARP